MAGDAFPRAPSPHTSLPPLRARPRARALALSSPPFAYHLIGVHFPCVFTHYLPSFGGVFSVPLLRRILVRPSTSAWAGSLALPPSGHLLVNFMVPGFGL